MPNPDSYWHSEEYPNKSASKWLCGLAKPRHAEQRCDLAIYHSGCFKQPKMISAYSAIIDTTATKIRYSIVSSFMGV
jgi:hypothetical protein